MRKLLFRFLRFYVFSEQNRRNDSKIQKAIRVPKIHPRMASGEPCWVKNYPEFTRERPKKSQNCRNCRNLHMILRERSSGRGPSRGKLREMPPREIIIIRAPVRPPKPHPVIILLIMIIIIIIKIIMIMIIIITINNADNSNHKR